MTEKYKCLQQSLFLVWKTFSLWDLFWRFIWLMNFHHVRRMLRSWIFKSSSFIGWCFSGNAIWISWILNVLRNNDTGVWNIVLVYIKSILRGKLGDILHLFVILQNIKRWSIPTFGKEQHFSCKTCFELSPTASKSLIVSFLHHAKSDLA